MRWLYRALALAASAPILLVYALYLPKVTLVGTYVTVAFAAGLLLPVLLGLYESKWGVNLAHSTLALTLLMLMLHRLIVVVNVLSGLLVSVPLTWCASLMLTRRKRTDLAVLLPTIAYPMAVFSGIAANMAPVEFLGLGFVAVVESCFRSLLGPAVPMPRIYYLNSSLYFTYLVGAISSILYVVDWDGRGRRWDVVAVEASKNLFLAAAATGGFLILTYYLAPIKHSLIVYPMVFSAALSYTVYRRLRLLR